MSGRRSVWPAMRRSGGKFAYHSPCQAPPTSIPRAGGALGVRGLSWSWRKPTSRLVVAKGVGGLMTFRNESAQARSEVCLTCHQKETEQFHFRRSEHKLTGVACNDCHAPHFPAAPVHLLRQKTPDLCFSCHREVRSCFCPASAPQGPGRCRALHRLPYAAWQPESFFPPRVYTTRPARGAISRKVAHSPLNIWPVALRGARAVTCRTDRRTSFS